MVLLDQSARSEASVVFDRAGLPREVVAAWLDCDDAVTADETKSFGRTKSGSGGDCRTRLRHTRQISRCSCRDGLSPPDRKPFEIQTCRRFGTRCGGGRARPGAG